MKKLTSKQKRNEVLKKRYQVYRRLGYDSKTASALSQRSLDVSMLEISKKTGKLKRNTVTKTYINKTMQEWKNQQAIDNYNKRIETIENDTVYTLHGLFTHDKRYKGENGKIISIIKNENKLSRDQAYYFWYFMKRYNLSYKETKRQLLSNKEFEDYDKRKRQRIAKRKQEIIIKKQEKLARKLGY